MTSAVRVPHFCAIVKRYTKKCGRIYIQFENSIIWKKEADTEIPMYVPGGSGKTDNGQNIRKNRKHGEKK